MTIVMCFCLLNNISCFIPYHKHKVHIEGNLHSIKQENQLLFPENSLSFLSTVPLLMLKDALCKYTCKETV